MTEPNPRLKNPPVSEAVFELRFDNNPDTDYTLLAGQLSTKLHSIYPKIKSLVPPGMPLGFPANLIRHRFLKNSEKEFFQIGENVLSVGILEYKSFENFLEDIKIVLKNHHSIFGLNNHTRLGLRYVNKIVSKKEIDKILNLQFIFPDAFKDDKEILVSRIVKNVGKNGKLATTVQFNYQKNEIMLDFDLFLEGPNKYDLANILKWVKDSHSIIYKIFIQCLNEDFYNRIK